MRLWEKNGKRNSSAIRRARRKDAERRARRAMTIEKCEDRILMAADAGPDLIAIIPNTGSLIRFDNTSKFNEAPRELLFRFDGGQQIDVTTLNGIKIERGGADRDLSTTADNITVLPGFIGVGGPPGENEVVFRFAEALPDDQYRITIVGAGANALKNVDGFAFQETSVTADGDGEGDGVNKVVEFRLDLGAKVLSVVPQPVRAGTPAWNEIDVYFDDPAISLDASFFQLINTNNTATTNDDGAPLVPTITSTPSGSGLRVTLNFGPNIPVGSYRLRIGNNEQPLVTTPHALGADADLVNGTNQNSTIGTADPLGTLTEGAVLITSSIDPQFFPLQLPGGDDEPGHRDAPAQNHLIDLFRPNYTEADLQDNEARPEIYYYSFPTLYGVINGQTVSSSISPVQRQRAREALDVYARYAGVQFIEVPAGTQIADLALAPNERFFRIVTGDPRAIDPDIPANSVDVISGYNMALDRETNEPVAGAVVTTVVNTRIADQDPAANYGGEYFFSLMQGIGAVLGLGGAYELSVTRGGIAVASSRSTAANDNNLEPVYPGPNDIVHLQHLHRPDSKDIDFYSFTLDAAGAVQLELTAERLANPSLLDGVITVFDAAGNIVARNDNYFSQDSYLNLSLAAGNYYVVVTASGNTDFDPRLNDSGFGGRTFGDYNLRVTYRPTLVDVADAIIDNDGTQLDGDADGVAGGAFNFWFTAGSANTTKFVKATNNPTATGNGTIGNPYQTVAQAFAASTQITTIRQGTAALDEQQRISSTATTGSFYLTFQGQTTAELPFNISAVNLQTALRNLSTIGPTGVVVTGSPGNWTVTFTGPLAKTNVSELEPTFGVVRLLADPGADGQLSTPGDATPYLIGKDVLGGNHKDGATMEAPRGVTVMVDAGAVIKLRQANIGVGSSSVTVNRGRSALQILGTPEARVTITSANDDLSATVSTDVAGQTNPASPANVAPVAGDWGGIVYRDDSDYEAAGIFLNAVNFADIRYGGGEVSVDGQTARFSPIHLTKARPAITNNFITRSADSAISADPDSFEESHFLGNDFTADYDRVGPDVYGNSLIENSINGLFVRIRTLAGQIIDRLTVAGRFDDTDIAHVIAESLLISSNPGGLIASDVNGNNLTARLDASLTIDPGTIVKLRSARIEAQLGAQFLAEGLAGKPIIFTSLGDDRFGSLLSHRFVDPNSNTKLVDNTTVIQGGDADTDPDLDPRVAARYAAAGAFDTNSNNQFFTLTIPASPKTTIQDGETFTIQYGPNNTGVTFEFDKGDGVVADGNILINLADAALANTPEAVARLIADGINSLIFNFANLANISVRARTGGGQPGQPLGRVIISGALAIQQSAIRAVTVSATAAEVNEAVGDWAGIYFAPTATGGIDQASLSFGGGTATTPGGSKNFNPVEIYQADVRIANTVFVGNADGFDQANLNDRRNGLGANAAAAIFVRGAQPIIVGNTFRGDGGAVISIDANSLTAPPKGDVGRSTGRIARISQFDDNHGPLVRLNRLQSNDINGMVVRGGTVSTEVIWDDTDIVHVVFEEIIVSNHHTYSGLQLRSSAKESLVVKLQGASAGFTATGRRLDIDDRIGGSLYVLGSPGHPVVLTSFTDDSVGAGITPGGAPANDTNNNGVSSGVPGQWRGILIDQNANDRNVAFVNELEPGLTGGVDLNGAVDANLSPISPQVLGGLAPNQKAGDDNRRLGYQVTGTISPDAPNDVDIYRFDATRGTDVWIDIDRTSTRLDTVVELIAADGTILASSENSFAEFNALPDSEKSAFHNAFGVQDLYSVNLKDAGIHIVLTGDTDEVSPYFVRVRSAQGGVFDPNSPGGQTSGEYRLQIRLQSRDEVPGTTVQFSDIRFAVTGIELVGLPGHSPLLGEFSEKSATNDDATQAQPLGNLLASDRNVLSVAGALSSATDIDWYKFTIDYNFLQSILNVDNGGKTWATIFDIDYADGLARPDSILSVFDDQGRLLFVGRDSDVADDQPAFGQGADTDDLTRGSFGKLDPYIGSVQLPTSVPAGAGENGPPKTYFVAVSSNRQIPTQLNYTLNGAPSNEIAKLEPISSIRRIVEEHGDYSGVGSYDRLDNFAGTTPVAGKVFDIDSTLRLQTNIKKFTLSDVPLYATSGAALNLVDGSTGFGEVSFPALGVGPFPLNELAMRDDGRLFAVRPGAGGDDGNAGQFSELDGSSAIISTAGDGISNTELPGGSSIEALAWQRVGFAGSINDNFNLFYSVQGAGGTFLFQANEVSGSAAPAPGTPYGRKGIGAIGSNFPGIGRTLGLAFVGPTGGQALIGVSDNGFAYQINTSNGQIIGSPVQLGVNQGFSPISFAGLTNAPKHIDFNQDGVFGDLETTVIAVSSSGLMYAFDETAFMAGTIGNLKPIFDTNADAVFEDGVVVSGDLEFFAPTFGDSIAFSPVDVNLWHPTAFKGTDPGHGVNSSPDQTRIDESQLARGQAGSPAFSERAGGYSFYFGLEEWVEPVNTNYVRYGSDPLSAADQPNTDLINSQYGWSADAFRALTSNAAIGNNYNIIGGSRGSLISDGFSLQGYAPTDKPTLYFNYFLETQNAAGGVDGGDMRDSARVFATATSTAPTITTLVQGGIGTNERQRIQLNATGGTFNLTFNGQKTPDLSATISTIELQQALRNLSNIGPLDVDVSGTPGDWIVEFKNGLGNTDVSQLVGAGGRIEVMLATNNSTRAPTRTDTDNSELPRYYTFDDDSARTGDPRQKVQELFDTTDGSNQWRQARVDLGVLAGMTDIQLRFDFATAGSMTDFGLPGTSARFDETVMPGDEFGGASHPDVTADNNHIGFLVDDIIVGFAERGEMVTGATTTTGEFFAMPTDPQFGNPVESLSGPYQLSIRSGTPHGTIESQVIVNDVLLDTINLLDTNDRLTDHSWLASHYHDYKTIIQPRIELVRQGSATVNEVQSISLDTSTPGTFTIAFRGETSTPIAHTATALDVQIALETISSLTGNVLVTGTAGAWSVEFTGALANTNVELLSERMNLLLSPLFETLTDGSATNSETQGLQLVTTEPGFFTLFFRGETTAPIRHDASTTEVRMALEALSTIGAGNVLVGGVPGQWGVLFTGALANQNVPELKSGNSSTTFSGAPEANGAGVLTVTARGEFFAQFSPIQLFVGPLALYDENHEFLTFLFQDVGFLDPAALRIDRVSFTEEQLDGWLQDGSVTFFVGDYTPFTTPTFIGTFDSLEFDLDYSTAALPDGGTFTIFDGVNSHAFEFDLNGGGLNDATATPIVFTGLEEPHELALKIRDAINNYAATTVGIPNVTPFRVIASVQTSSSKLAGKLNEVLGYDRIELTNAENVTLSGGLELPGFADSFLEIVNDRFDDLDDRLRDRVGDQNRPREQGYTLISNNVVVGAAEYAIKVRSIRGESDTDVRNNPAAPINFNPQHTTRLAPGLTIENNLIFGNAVGGIYYAGDEVLNGISGPNAVPYGRIVNNTIFGRSDVLIGIGINIDNNAAPVVINNILSRLETGIVIQSDSVGLRDSANNIIPDSSPVLQGNLYKDNGVNFDLKGVSQSFQIVLGVNDPLFVNPANGVFNFYLAPNSQAIDSSVDVVAERDAMLGVIGSLGIAPSPALAPDIDLVGQLRRDDTTFPNGSGGVGGNVFKDRGALERSDIAGPVAVLVDPIDNGVDDLETNFTELLLSREFVSVFSIQLQDGIGIGIRDGSVSVAPAYTNSSRVIVKENGVRLVAGQDYFFNYDNNTDTIRITSAAGIFNNGSTYTIQLDNGVVFEDTPVGISDIAGNFLRPNQVDGSTLFTITLGDAINDAPEITGPASVIARVNTPLVLSQAMGTGVSINDIDSGSRDLFVTLTLTGGESITLATTAGLTAGDLDGSDGTLSFFGSEDEINAALASLTLTFPTNYIGPAQLDIVVDDQGNTGTGGPLQDSLSIAISVMPPNSAPQIDNALGAFSMFEDLPIASNNGVTVQSLVDVLPDPISDVDAGAVEGIAVINATNGTNPPSVAFPNGVNGTWQYSIDGGSTWLTFGVVTESSATLLTDDPLSRIRFVPSLNFNGMVTLTVRAWDRTDNRANGATGVNTSGANNGGETAFSSDTTIGAVVVQNVRPEMNPIADRTINEDAPPQTVNLTNIHTEPPGAPNNPIVITATSSHPTIIPNPTVTYTHPSTTGTLTYQPLPNANTQVSGPVTITVTLTQTGPTPGDVDTTQYTFTVTVNPIPDPPVPTPTQTVTTPEDTEAIIVLDGTDADGDTFVAIVQTLPARGDLYQVIGAGTRGPQITAPGTVVTDPARRVIFVPDADQNGTPFDSFQYGLRDSTNLLSTTNGTVNINVTPVNDQPRLPNPIADQSVPEDSGDVFIDLANVFFDPDVATNGDVLTYTIEDNSNDGLITASLSGSVLRLQLTENAFGFAIIRVRTTDVAGLFREDEFRIDVTPVNDAPVVTPLPAQTTLEDTDVFITFTGTDVENDQFFAVITQLPTKGRLFQVVNNARGPQITSPNTAITDPANRVIFAPNADQNGTPFDTLKYVLRDTGNADSIEASVTVNVTPVNDAPRVVNPVADRTVDEDAADLFFDLSNVFFDPDVLTNGDMLNVGLIGNSNPNLVETTQNGSLLRVRLLPNANGFADLTIRATDTRGLFVEDVFRINVNPVNDPAVANDLNVLVLDNNAQVVGGQITVTDIDQTVLVAALVTQPQYGGSVEFRSDGSFLYTKPANFVGIDRFTYRIFDGGQASNIATVTIESLDARVIYGFYNDLFNRVPSDQELLFWINTLRTNNFEFVASQFVRGAERRTNIINQLYLDYLGRPVDNGGLQYWLGEFDRTGGAEVVQIGLLSSNEFYTNAGATPGNSRNWVIALYDTLLDRQFAEGEVTNAEITYWANLVDRGIVTRDAVVRGFVTSDEYRGEVIVRNLYLTLLNRELETAGKNFWVGEMRDQFDQFGNLVRKGITQDELAIMILSSDEYRRSEYLTGRL